MHGALCGDAALDGDSTLKEETLSDRCVASQFEGEFDDADESNEILHNNPNLQTADISADVSHSIVKDNPCAPSSTTEGYENIHFSDHVNDGRIFANTEEIISNLKEAMEYQS